MHWLHQTESLLLIKKSHVQLLNSAVPENKRGGESYSPGVELAAAPKTGVELACCPKTGAVLGFAPKDGVWEGGAVKGDPKEDPNEGVWLVLNPPEGAELKANGAGAADGAVINKRQ